MEEVELLETFDQHQRFPLDDHRLSNCNIPSDNDTTDSSSSNVSEDEASIKTEPTNPEIGESPLSSSGNRNSIDSNDVSLEPFVHQVGGHIPMVCLDADTVCKPLIEREHRFYRSIPESLKRFTPRFEGLMHIEMKAKPDGCIALRGNPPCDRESLDSTGLKGIASNRRENKRMKSRQKLHLLLQHLQNSEDGSRNHEFEWVDSKSKLRVSPIAPQGNGLNTEATQSSKNHLEKTSNDRSGEIDGNHQNDPTAVKENDLSSGSNLDLELFYNPWALKCHQDHFKKLGLKSSDTVAISSKPEIGTTIAHFPKTRCTYLLLENVVSSQLRPCILDLKVGARQYPDDCSSTKKKSKMAKSAQTTSATLGLRLCGMQVFDTSTEKYICLNKYHGRSLSDQAFIDSIQQFLNKNGNGNNNSFRDDVRKQLILKLRDLIAELQGLDSFRFYTSSLLVTYDGYCHSKLRQLNVNSIGKPCDKNDASHSAESHEMECDNVSSTSAKDEGYDHDTENLQNDQLHNASEPGLSNTLVDVRLIDFAHATHIGMNDKGVYEGPDDNFISGISNFLSILEEL